MSWFILLNAAATLFHGSPTTWREYRQPVQYVEPAKAQPVIDVGPVSPTDLPRTAIDSHVKYYPVN